MVKFDPQIHHRRSVRLKEYDYSQAGAYFITIVTYQRELIFGEIVNAEMKLSHCGKIVEKWWDEIPSHFPNVETGAFVVMPNHVHGIIFIVERRGAVPAPRNYQFINNLGNLQNIKNKELNKPINSDKTTNLGGETPPLHRPTLGQIIAYFKYQSNKEMNTVENTNRKFWQRSYHEHIIRNETDLKNKTDYIQANPLLWEQDEENPNNIK
jgi:putative transposase